MWIPLIWRHSCKIIPKAMLDANESKVSSSRLWLYPEPHGWAFRWSVTKYILERYSVALSENEILPTCGGEHAIECLLEYVRYQGKKIVITPPTFALYSNYADIKGVECESIQLNPDFQLDLVTILAKTRPEESVILLCSPGNPTGISLNWTDILTILGHGYTVIVDEAYVGFASGESILSHLPNEKNLYVIQSMSKAFSVPWLRLGYIISTRDNIDSLLPFVVPYCISTPQIEEWVKILSQWRTNEPNIAKILLEKMRLGEELFRMRGVKRVLDTETNFLIAEFDNGTKVYELLSSKGVFIYEIPLHLPHLGWMYRITVGTSQENDTLLNELASIFKTHA